MNSVSMPQLHRVEFDGDGLDIAIRYADIFAAKMSREVGALALRALLGCLDDDTIAAEIRHWDETHGRTRAPESV